MSRYGGYYPVIKLDERLIFIRKVTAKMIEDKIGFIPYKILNDT